MLVIKLLSYQPEEEIAIKALKLWREGRVIDTKPLRKLSAPVGEIGELSPAVIVFDCDRLPLRAREVAEALRVSTSAREIPLLFAGGYGEIMERLHVANRRAVFTSWAAASEALDRLLKAI